jgi:ATP-dependent RNA helicase DeaD
LFYHSIEIGGKMTFEKLQLKQELVDSLKALKLEKPTEVQEKAIPELLTGKDLIVRSKTGSGKTFAFLLPALNGITKDKKLQGLILTPTRELADQVAKEAKKLNPKLSVTVIYGGVSINPQIDRLEQGTQLVVATPGRMLDHIGRGTVDFSNLKYAILDEADRMLDMGFIEDVQNILSNSPKERQTMLFSATMPDEVVKLSHTYMRSPDTLMLQQDEVTVKKIKQRVIGLDRKKKVDQLLSILKESETEKIMIFVNTKTWAEKLSGLLYRRKFKSTSIHSGLSQNKRNKVIEQFNSGRYSILVATDVAARGLHINGVTHVINYDIPRNPKSYVHRIGRTGRAGEEGHAITFVSQMDEPFLRAVEGEINMFLEVEYPGGKPLEKPQESRVDDWGLD